MQKEKNHIYYFDYLRVLASLCVVYMHVAANPLRGEIGPSWHITNLFTCFGFIAVPLFFMMSGYLLLSNEKTADVSVLLRHRIPHLLFPLVFWTAATVFLYSYLFKSMTLSYYIDSFKSALSAPSAVHLWFLYTLIAMYLISPVLYGGLKNLSRGGHILVLVLISLVSVKTVGQAFLPSSLDPLLSIDVIDKMSFFGGHLCTFILGYYIGGIKKKIPTGILIAAAVVLLGIITAGTYMFTVRYGAYNQTFQQQGSGFQVILAVLVFLIFKQNFNKKSRILGVGEIVNLSFAIYFIHIPIIDIMNRTAIRNDSFADTVILTAAVFILSYIVMKTAASVKPLCFITTGIPYKKACDSCNWIYTYRQIKKKLKKDDTEKSAKEAEFVEK